MRRQMSLKITVGMYLIFSVLQGSPACGYGSRPAGSDDW